MSIPDFTLTVLENFKCLASDCPDDCCSYGWDITVEDHILEKWKNIPDPDLRNRVLDVVFEKEIDGKNKHVISSKERVCNLQEDNGLCLIHDKLGEEFLCNTCRKYPRVTATFSNYTLSSATMSCPEIARLIVEQQDNQDVFKLNGNLSAIEEPAGSINEFVDKVLSKNNYSIAARTMTIARFLVEISVLSQRGELDLARLQAICRKVGKPLKDAERDIRSNKLKIDTAVAGRFWSALYRLISTGLQFKLDDRIQQHPVTEMLGNKSMSEESLRNLYKELTRLRLASSQIMQKEMEGIGERYLSVKFRDVGFPLEPPAGNYIAAFLFGILPYCFINLNLWILYDIDKKITKEDIVDVIYRTERIVQHTQRIYNSIIENQIFLYIDEYDACISELF